jgi:hypothetical protein
MSYYEHCTFSLTLARHFAVGSLKAIVHAFFPQLFLTSSTDLVRMLVHELEAAGCKKEG